jgi:ATP-dependent Clp protease adapter protein ClpS
MHDICTDPGPITLFIHNDDDTPVEFVRQLLRNVFGKSEREAIAFTALIENEEKVACGPYPGPVAKALLDSARQNISAARSWFADHQRNRDHERRMRSLRSTGDWQ